MTTKNTSCLLLSSLLLCTLIPSFIPFAQALNQRSLWGLIIGGSDGGSFSNNTQYMYHMLSEHYDFDGIYYLDVYTDRLGVNALSTKANVRWSITNWLASHSDENDIIFIHFSSHGGGYYSGLNHLLPYSISGGRYDASMDEGDELQESGFLELCWVLHALYDIRRDNVPPWDWVRNFDTDPYIEIDLDSDGTIDIELNNLEDLDGDGWNDDILLDPDIDDCCDIAIDADANHDGTIDNFVSDGEAAAAVILVAYSRSSWRRHHSRYSSQTEERQEEERG